jgi:hypothetical protein
MHKITSAADSMEPVFLGDRDQDFLLLGNAHGIDCVSNNVPGICGSADVPVMFGATITGRDLELADLGLEISKRDPQSGHGQIDPATMTSQSIHESPKNKGPPVMRAGRAECRR